MSHISNSSQTSCPICQKPSAQTFMPFCSKVCKNIDLIHWFRQDYRIPTQESATDEDTTSTEES